MIEVLLGALLIAVTVLVLAVVALWRRLWLLMVSIECLCTNVGRLADRLPALPGDGRSGA